MKKMETILVLDGHTNQALACARSLGKAGYRVVVASHQRSPLSAWSRYCADSYRLKDQTTQAFAALRSWALRAGVQIVLPLTERSCVLCNEDREQWEAAGMIVGCGSNDMLQNAFDKGLTLKLAEANGVRIPPTRIPNSFEECLEAAEEIGFQCVVKPRCSNAWNGTKFLPTQSPTYVSNRGQLQKLLAATHEDSGWPLIQSFVPGRGKGVFALCDRGRVVAWFAHERLRDTRPTGSSSSLRRSVQLQPRLREPAEKLLAAMKWHGPAMVEFKDDGVNPPCLMEVNGRFWGSLQLAIDAGVDFPRLWVSILKGEDIPVSSTFEEGVILRWIWGDLKRLFFIMKGRPSGYPGEFPKLREGFRDLIGPQPSGTRLEMWRTHDPMPGLGEVLGGFRELITWRDLLKSTNGHETKVNGLLQTNGNHLAAVMPHRNGGSNPEITIREANTQELEAWDDLVMRFDNYRVTHKRAWMNSLQASVKGQPLYLIFEKGNQIVGCLPGFLTNIGPLRLFGSPLQGWQTVSMGPVFDKNLVNTQQLISPLIEYLENEYSVHHIEIISRELEEKALGDLRFRSEPLPTFRMRMFPGNEERSMKLMKDSARRNVRRARKLGLVVKFEEDESFVDEHYDQLREVFARGGNTLPFGKKRALDFFRHMKAGGNLIAVSVYLPDGGPNIATGMFSIEGKELLLWMWTHRTEHRWYRPTELMTWTVMEKAMSMGCDTFDFMGRGDFKAKFGAELDVTKHRWSRSRYEWLATTRTLAGRGYKWQQSMRGRVIRRVLFNGAAHPEAETQPRSELKGAA